MKRFDVKQLVICILAVLSSRFEVAGVHPLVPAIFMTGFLSGVNRSLLFLCTIGGLVVLAPVTVLVKYGLAVILSAVLVKFIEWYFQKCGGCGHGHCHRGNHPFLGTDEDSQHKYGADRNTGGDFYLWIRVCVYPAFLSVFGLGASDAGSGTGICTGRTKTE